MVYLFPRTYDEDLLSKVDSMVEAPSEAVPSSGMARNKRNPGCMKKCLRMRVLHPAQCHYLC